MTPAALSGITPSGFGFSAVNLWPAPSLSWKNQPVAISVTLPDGGFLQYSYLYEPEKRTVTLRMETDRQRQGHFRVPLPGLTKLAWWNGVETRGTVATRPGGRWEIFSLDRDFTKSALRVEVQ